MNEQYHNPAQPTPQTEPRPRFKSPRPEGATLGEHHRDYLTARAVNTDVAGEMFWTSRRPSQVPAVFSERQRRRGDSLIAAFPSPDGVTVGYQKRDDRPGRDRKGKRLNWVSPPAERARIVLGVVPSMLDEVRSGNGPLWVVEGLTRGAALAPRGKPSVSYAGCYNWQKDGEPLPCWEHVNLRDRLVFDVPDADARTNEHVQKAQAERIAFLESRGARVLVVDVPEVHGNANAGLDDYLAAGGELLTLERNARPFKPMDVGRERLKRDELLWQFVAVKRQEVEALPVRRTAECNAVKVARFLVEVAPKHGKMDERGATVHPSFPQIAEGTRLGSFQTVRKALDHLESVGFLVRLGRRSPKEATSYLLLDPRGGGSAQSVNIGTQGGAGEEGQEPRAQEGEHNETPRNQRDSYACLHSAHVAMKNVTSPEKVPALRSSKLVHTYGLRDGRRVVVHSDYYWRYGPKREEIFRYLLETAGASRAELHEKFGSKTSRLGRFVETWIGPMLRDGVAVEGGSLIFPAPDWPEALERVRAQTDEHTDNRLQSQKYARRRREYRDYLERRGRGEDTKAEPTPELSGRERVEEMLESRRPEWERQRIEREREKVGTTAAAFVADALEGTTGVRYRELRQLWTAKGGNGEDLRRAATRSPFRLSREADGYLYVYPIDTPAPARQEPATVAVLHGPPPKPEVEPSRRREPLTQVDPGEADPGGDWRDHPLDCKCQRCSAPPSRYATPRSAS